jgi:O-antigen/teichoic acid export membrane protein
MAMLIVHLAFIFVSKPLIYMLTAGKYTEAYKYANLLTIAYYFMLLFSFSSAILKALNQTNSIFLINFIVGLLSLILVPFFINGWQYFGAGIVQIILYSVLFLISTLFILTKIHTDSVKSGLS